MSVFSKYLLKSMLEKKGRTFLLLISISISAALLVASLGSVKALLGTLTTEIKANFGGYNVQVSPAKSLGVPLFSTDGIAEYSNGGKITKTFRDVSAGGYIPGKDKEFYLSGTTLENIKKFDSMKITKQMGLEPFIGKKLIISEKTAKLLKVALGDTLELNVMGKADHYTVAAIAINKGLFFNDSEKQFTIVTPEENIFSIYGVTDKYSSMMLAVDTQDLNKWIKDFNKTNYENKLFASKIFDEEQIEQQANILKMPLYFMLVIVLIMTTFIIYSSFKLIITERLSVIGVFLSQGATKLKIMSILITESIMYGIFGGIIGDLMGAGLTKLISFYGNPLKEFGVTATTEYYIPYFLTGFIFALFLSLISTILPILSIRKLPVKDVILNTIGTASKISMKTFVIGMTFVIISILLHIIGPSIDNAGSVPAILLGFMGVILIIPKIVDTLFYPAVRFLRNINGLSMLSFNNVRTSKVLINNIRLITVAVISIVMINSLSYSIKDVVRGAYDGMNFDVRIDIHSDNTKGANEIIKNYAEIKKMNVEGMTTAYLNGDTTKLMLINFIDPELYKTFENYTVFEDKNKELDALKANDDGIIISRQMSVRYGIKAGDTISIATDYQTVKLKVLSVYNAKMLNSGNCNLISTKATLKHFDVRYPTTYSLETKIAADKAKAELEKMLKGYGASLVTKAQMSKDNEKANKQMTDVLGIFAYITMVIGAFGIISNVSISFIQRKREIAVLSSVGMTQSGRGHMIFLESIFQALIGTLISLIAAYGIIILLGDVFKFITMDLDLTYPYESIVVIVIATILLMLVTSLSSIFKSKRLVIVQELKYE